MSDNGYQSVQSQKACDFLPAVINHPDGLISRFSWLAVKISYLTKYKNML